MLLSSAFLLSLAVSASAQPTGKWFDKYMIIMLENMDFKAILANPTFSEIASKGILLDNYHGTTHPSQPNYWSVIAAAANFPNHTYVANTTTPFPINGDDGDSPIDIWNEITLAEIMQPAGLTYNMYSEEYPTSGQCWLGSGFGNETKQDVANYNVGAIGTNPYDRLYARKHNPFISFKTYVDSHTRCATQKSFDDLYSDIAAGTLPHFSMVVPTQAQDNHDVTTNFTAIFMQQFMTDLLMGPDFVNSRVLVHITYDEDDTAYTYYYNAPLNNDGSPNPYYNASCTYGPNSPPNYCAPAGCTNLLDCTLDKNDNKVYTVLTGNAVPSTMVGSTDSTYYNHYSVAATLEANWGLSSMERYDRSAHVFSL